ncbi:ACP phosphodiesterase [Vibrio sp. WXL103]|uniref:acyl carrier protein phosphodiesterase n=1 Tax=unclassified Vibrio TaxID=2614977 RepID=UPI003EC932B7
MNFLAHLHIAHHCNSSLLGNLLGDFVKGDPHKQFAKDIADGILLHRFVDSYTDYHDTVLLCKSKFDQKQRRFSPIALDMFWDHCLAKHWQRYHSKPLACFVEFAKTQTDIIHPDLPARFLSVSQHMWQERWLESYQEFDNILYALNRIAQRRPRLAALSDCQHSLVRHYDCFESRFDTLYQEVLTSAMRRQYQLNSTKK